MKKTLVALALLCANLATAETLAQAPQAIEDFVGRPSYGTVKISPDGEYLAVTVDRGD